VRGTVPYLARAKHAEKRAEQLHFDCSPTKHTLLGL
jgi:hypothetical protein